MSGKNSLLDSMDKNNHMQMINEASSDGSSQGKIKETLPFFQVLAGVQEDLEEEARVLSEGEDFTGW